MHEQTAALGLAAAITETARRQGAEVGRLLDSLGLAEEHLCDLEARVPAQALMVLSERLAAETGDPLFGLRVAEQADAAAFGVLGFALRSSSTLGEALERVIRFASVLNETTEMRLERAGDRATIYDGPTPPQAWPRAYAEQAMGHFLVLARRWSGTQICPIEVGFQHQVPAELERALERFFGCPVYSDQPTNRIVFPRAALQLGFRQAEPALAEYLERQLLTARASLRDSPAGLRAVRAEIARQLRKSAPTLAGVARALSLSRRTLQRRLQGQASSFDQLLDTVRRELALGAIRRPEVTVEELSDLCRYNDPRAFRRAFRRWTGRTPQAYLQALKIGAEGSSNGA
ncbi:MAG: AraC family transcriptional regulator [Myxococcota bacterium]